MKDCKNIVIAIDGPAASGKGSLAKKLAEELGYDFLDTGSLYRRIALKCLQDKVDPADHQAVIETARAMEEELGQGYDDSALRTDDVGSTASKIAQIQAVRDVLVDFQRNFARKAPKGAVLDGRDIGTVICPEADIKLFVTASTEKRAERRHKELQSRGLNVTNATVLAEMQERDARDASRLNAHLTPNHEVNMIDTSDMTPEEVLDTAMKIVRSYNKP